MHTLEPIAHIRCAYTSKFAIPRQSGIVRLRSEIVFTPDHSNPDAVRGIEGFSHLWLIWGFSENPSGSHSPTVRPPRLGGNRRMGVFATRSPFRPNGLGLSSVELEGAEITPHGVSLHIIGADLMNGTPIYDIKPYLPYTDSHPDAAAGFTDTPSDRLTVVCDADAIHCDLPDETRALLCEVLANDPRPRYQNDPTRIYGFDFDGFEIKFFVNDGILTVTSVLRG